MHTPKRRFPAPEEVQTGNSANIYNNRTGDSIQQQLVQGTGETAQGLRVLAALPESQGWIPSIHPSSDSHLSVTPDSGHPHMWYI